MSNLLYSLFRNYIFYRDTDSLGKIIKCLSWLKSAETGAEENAIFFHSSTRKKKPWNNGTRYHQHLWLVHHVQY